jgi:hypothetical protein
MKWVVWRLHRGEATCSAVAAAACMAALGYSVIQLYALRSGADENGMLVAFNHQLSPILMMVLSPALLLLPAIAGVFIGAPLLARELEQGTYKVLLTQGLARGRWFATTLALVLLPIIVGGILIGALAAIWVNAQGRLGNAWNDFDIQGPAFVAYGVFAVALGATLGVLLSRSVPAMAATVMGYGVVRAAVQVLLRPRFEAPVRVSASAPIPDGSWVFPATYTDASARVVSADHVARILSHAGRISGSVPDYLRAHGIYSWVEYQPAVRFWTFQAIEAAIFLALAVLFTTLSIYAVMRR